MHDRAIVVRQTKRIDFIPSILLECTLETLNANKTIRENQWYFNDINSQQKENKKYLPLSEKFVQKFGCTNSIIAHTIFCVAQAYSIKDRHGQEKKEL